MKFVIALALGATVLATPAAAQSDAFTGVRIGATAGIDDVTNSPDRNDVVYGAEVGIDAPVFGDKMIVGLEAFSTNPFEDTRTVGAAARIGYAVTPEYLIFARGGYSNYENVFSQNLDGLTVGGGVEAALIPNTYIKAEYRYSDFEQGVGNHGALVGVGLRF